jgi:DNA-binding IclR family transcriptional regulator
VKEGKDYTIEAVRQAGEILKFIAEQREPVTSADAARACGITTNTAFRQCWTLSERLGFLDRVGDRYRLGARLALIWAKRKSIVEGTIQRAESELRELSEGAEA